MSFRTINNEKLTEPGSCKFIHLMHQRKLNYRSVHGQSGQESEIFLLTLSELKYYRPHELQ